MLYLIVIVLVLVLAWVGRRYWLLRRGVGLLADAVTQRRSFLNDDDTLPQLHPDWRRLVGGTGALIHETARLKQMRAGQLSQLEATLSSLQEGVLIIDRDNYVLLANQAVSEIFSAAKHAVGKRIEVILHSAEFLRLLDAVRGGRAGGRTEIEFIEHGESVWVEATGTVVQDTREQNGPWCVFVIHDISRQRELEVIRKEFVANVSHELKTPISMVRGYAETLSDDDGSVSPADRVKFAKTIFRHAERLSAIVDDLLTLSRLESGGEILEPTWEDVAGILRDAADDFRARFQSSGHVLECAPPTEAVVVNIDALRIGQVLGNLLENAQKYTPNGTRVEIGARLDPETNMVELWVGDRGPGIPAQDLPRIFERFYRVEKGRSRDKGGTGLGLSIVKHIVQLHGGRVAAESVVGEGTRMVFWLPGKLAGNPLSASPRAAAISGHT